MMAPDTTEPVPGFKTTLYYTPEGECEGAYIELAAGRAVRKADPDPRYLLSVYFGEGDVPLGIRIFERVPVSVIKKAAELIIGAHPGLKRQMADAQATLAAA